MAIILLIGLLFVSVEMKTIEVSQSVEKREAVCFGTLGCFSTDAPFTSTERPVSVAPESPDRVLTKFLLYTRESQNTAQQLDARSPEHATSTLTHFKQRPTKILIHGFLDSPTLTSLWMNLKNELLKHSDYNVVIVDWSSGNQAPYDQACANARVVGAQISELIQSLISLANVTAGSFHIIGHSLGAHVCGYAGERVPGLGRITGLDPAGPYFENTDKVVRLDPSDAVFIDVIHTDGKNLLELGLGTKTPSGHADFYPNMGHDQPECTRDPIQNILHEGLIEGVEDTAACSHIRAVRYFTESVNSQCPFMGFPCASDADFQNNLCHSCSADGCAPMGLKADSHIPPNGQLVKYYLSTAGHKPYCQYHFTITLKFTYGQGQAERGTLDVLVAGDSGSTFTVSLTGDSNPTTFTPGQAYKFYVMVPSSIGNVRAVTFTWTQNASWFDPLHWNILGLRDPKLYLDEIDVYRDEAGVDVHLCAHGQSVETGTSITLATRC